MEEDDGAAEREAEERAATERAEREARASRERKEKQEQEQRARAAAAAAEGERKLKEKEKRDLEEHEHEREERARREKEREEDAEEEARRERRAAKAAAKAARANKVTPEGRKPVERRAHCHIHIDVFLMISSRYSPRSKPDARVARSYRAVPCRSRFPGLQERGTSPAQGERRYYRGAIREDVSRRYALCREDHKSRGSTLT